MGQKLNIAASLVVVAITAALVWKVTRPDPNANPILANGEAEITVLPFTSLASLDALPEGWTHRTFWSAPAMELALVEKDNIPAIRCETNASASILMRSTDIDLGTYPLLEWSWLVEQPIESEVDEASEAGDDHPIRLLAQLLDEDGGRHAFEIIWSNKKFAPGEYKYIGEFPHYVANGLADNLGAWQHQQADMVSIYHDISGRSDTPTLKSIGLFCDSDNTGARSIAYMSDVVLHQR